MVDMTNTFDPSQKRGQPHNKAQWVQDPKSDPEAVLPLPSQAEPVTYQHDGGQMRVYSMGGHEWAVEGAESDFRSEFTHEGIPTAKVAGRHLDEAELDFIKEDLEYARGEDDGSDLHGDIASLEHRIAHLNQRLSGATEWDHISAGDSDIFITNDDSVGELEIYRSDDGAVNAEARTSVNFKEGLPDGAAFDYLDSRTELIDKWVKDEYGAELVGDDWENTSVEFSVNLDDTSAQTAGEATDALRENTKIIELHNDLNGAYGTGKLYGFYTNLHLYLQAADAAAEDES